MQRIDNVIADLERAFRQGRREGAPRPANLPHPARLKTRLLRGETRRLRSEGRLGVPVPRFCMFSVTWRCNLRCEGCYARDYATDGSLSLPEIERIIREGIDLGMTFYVIVGGEPLLVPGLLEALARCRGGFFFLFTNGTLLGEEEARRIARARNLLPVISIEGEEAMTDARRGSGVGRKAARAMSLLDAHRVAFGVSCMVTHENVMTVTSRAWFDRVWAGGTRFAFLIDYVPMPDRSRPDLVLTPEDRAFKAERVVALCEEARPYVLNFPPDEYAQGGCQSAGRGFLHINADGYVEPCPFSHYAADNARERPLADILASDFLRELRDHFAGVHNTEGECILCAHDPDVRRIAGRTGAFFTETCGATHQNLPAT